MLYHPSGNGRFPYMEGESRFVPRTSRVGGSGLVVVRFEVPYLEIRILITSRYCLLTVLLLLAPDVFSESMPGKESVPSKEIQQRDARSNSEIRHAWKAAVENYPLRAIRLDLSALSDKEQKEIQSLLSDPIKTYVGIGRDVHLTVENWAMVKREDGFEIWQAQIHSPAALFLKVRFRDFDLGLGMSVKVYGLSGGGGARVGEYTGRGLGDDGMFWSLAAPGDTVVVEYRLPAELEMYPGDFPFRVERISHRFKDAGGKLSGVNVGRFVPRATCGAPTSVCSLGSGNERGVARYYVTLPSGRDTQCSGALLNSRLGDFAPYFLTAFHCIDDVVSSSEAPKGTPIEAEFEFRYNKCDNPGSVVRGNGAKFVAGSGESAADWALLHIDGELTGGSHNFLGWDPNSKESFKGYILHHPGGNLLRYSDFESVGLSYIAGSYSGGNSFGSCSGDNCSHLTLDLEQTAEDGASGAPAFSNGDFLVVGVYTHGSSADCRGQASRFSQIYEDGRVYGALEYGEGYFLGTGEARNFDDSARPVYYGVAPPPPVIRPPVIAQGQGTVSVDYGARSVSFSLNASVDDASSLSWQLVSGSGPRRGSVRFTDRTGPTAEVVYEVSGGIRQEDQFSIQVRGAGGTDVIVITVVPRQRTIDPPVIAEGAEEEFRVDYGVRSRSFSLNARADDASSLSWQLVSGSGPRRGSVRFTDRTGPTAEVVYEVSGGIRQEDQFSVQVRGAGGTDVIVITVIPRQRTIDPPVIAEGAEEEFRVDYGVRSRSFSLNARADDASSLSWQLVSGSGPRRGSVRFTDRTGSRAGIVYEVSGGIRQEDQFSVQVRGAGGTDVIVITVIPRQRTIDPPVIAEGVEEEFRVDYGVRSRSFSLNARADDASSLSWQLVSGSGPRRGSVRFTDRTGSRADIVYEVSGGIRQEDQFSIQVRGAGGTDVIVVKVVPNIGSPVIAEGAEEEFRVDYGVRSRSFSLNARADDASSLSWQLVSGSGPRRGSVRFTDRTGSRAGIVYEVSGGIRQEDQFSIQVRGAGGTDVIVITVVPNIDPPVISEGREKEFQVDYGVRSRSFSLNASADDASSLNWQLVSGSGPRRGNVRFTDRTGSRADIVYEVSGGIRQEDQFSIQVRGAGGTDVIVVKVVSIKPPEILDGTEKVVRVDYGTGSLSFSLTARSDYASSLNWQLVSGSGSRQGNVRFTDSTGSAAGIVYEVSGGVKEPDRFSVQVSGRGGSDVIDVRVVIVPVIVEGNEVELSVASGSTDVVLTLNAKAVGSNFLRWQLVPGSGPRQGNVRFTDSTGSTAGIVYEVFGGIRQKDQFVVQVGYGAQVGSGLGVGGSDEITILVMPDVPPVVTRVFGREVDGDDELTVYISPQTREVIFDVIALDEFPEMLKWTAVDAIDSTGRSFEESCLFTREEFCLSGSGGESVRVFYQRDPDVVKSGRFAIKVTDRLEQSDLLVLRFVEDETAPEIVNEGVMNTESGKTLEVKMPYHSEQLILGLVTRSARAGLRGKLVDSLPSPPTVSASFPQSDGEGGLKVDLQVPQSLDEALFRIRVSNGSASEDIVIRVTREQFIRVRSKVLLGGATR